MTVTKESLRSALETHTIHMAVLSGGAVYNAKEKVIAAARFVERLLPASCDHISHSIGFGETCPTCHGSGQIWDEGLVEVVAKAIYAYDNYPTMPWDQQLDSFRDTFRQIARAVLSALGQEVSK